MKTVICKEPIEGFLTSERQYTVIGERPEEGRLVLIDDRGLEGWFKESRFVVLSTPKGSPDFSEMQRSASDVKITQCPVVSEFFKTYWPKVEVDQSLGPDEWHLVFSDFQKLDNGLAQKHAWQGGSNMTSTFVVVRKSTAEAELEKVMNRWQVENNDLVNAYMKIDKLEKTVTALKTRLQHDISELKELIECERNLKDPVNTTYYKRIVDEIESVLKQVQS